MDRRTYEATKSPLPTYHAVVIEHPLLPGPLRYVADQFAPVALGGHEHAPMPMQIQPPDRIGPAAPRLVVTMPRAAVGRTFKQMLRAISAAASRAPIRVTYCTYTGGTAAPGEVWRMYAGAIAFDAESVEASCTDSNPMQRYPAPIYDPSVFTGLELI